MSRKLQPGVRREVERYAISLSEDAPSGHAAFITDNVLRSFPVPGTEVEGLDRVVSHFRDASKQIAASQPLSTQQLGNLDVSVEDFLKPLNPGPATRDLVYATVAWYTGTPRPGEVSILGTLAQIAGFGHTPPGFYSALTERFVGGAGALLDQMVSQSRIEVRRSHHVIAVEQGRDGVTVRTRDGVGVGVEGRSCVVAVPTNVMRHLEFSPALTPAKTRLLSRNHLGRAYKASLLVANAPTRPFALGTGSLQSLCFGYDFDDGTSLLMGFGDETSVDSPTDRAQLEAAVREYLPEAEVVAVDAHDWNADPLFDGTYRIDRPGEALPFICEMNKAEGRVVFAGTDVDDSVWRIWIEGAINSGHDAAGSISGILHRYQDC